eukprot:m.260048 g.260048  ORF g.260048 m.260048 type:complete len:167 (+) comp19208_c5_seq2:261-761(+)
MAASLVVFEDGMGMGGSAMRSQNMVAADCEDKENLPPQQRRTTADQCTAQRGPVRAHHLPTEYCQHPTAGGLSSADITSCLTACVPLMQVKSMMTTSAAPLASSRAPLKLLQQRDRKTEERTRQRNTNGKERRQTVSKRKSTAGGKGGSGVGGVGLGMNFRQGMIR